MTEKNFQHEFLPDKFLITRQNTKVRNPFATNLLSEIIESGGFLG